jgi:hypothetical protein
MTANGFKLERAAVRARDALFGFLRDGGGNVVLLVAIRAAQIVKRAWLSILPG